MRKGLRFGILYGIVLTAFTVYALLDVFVIPRGYTVVAESNKDLNTDSNSSSSSLSEDGGTSDSSGTNEDNNINSDNNSGISDSDSDNSGSSGSNNSDSSGSDSDGNGSSNSDSDDNGSSNSDSDDNGLSDSDSDGSSSSDSDNDYTDNTDYSGSSDPVITDSSYSDSNIRISINEYRENDTTIYVADVQVSSPEYLKTAFASNTYGRNIKDTTSSIAEEHGAILAVNGDFYGSQTEGYVIRNGQLFRSTSAGNEDLVIMADGSFQIIQEGSVSAEELLAQGAIQVLSFGPALVTDGTIAVTEGQEVGKAMASNPRTAIGIIDNCHYVMVVSDGRTSDSEGLSLYELAEFMESLGVETAYNLDGGGSSTMVFNGTVINNPTTGGRHIKERSVSDIVYIGY